MTTSQPDTVHYSVHYNPTAGARFAARAWVGVAIWTALAVVFFVVFGFVAVKNLGLAITVGLIMLIPALVSLTAALRAHERWSADGGLAIAISDNGVTLPHVGLIPWQNITAVKSFNMGIATGNVFLALIGFWNGTRENAYLTVFTPNTVTDIGALPAPVRRLAAPGGPGDGWGFKAARTAALGDAAFAEASAALLHAAQQRGIPVLP